jgi:hypothetical protein
MGKLVLAVCGVLLLASCTTIRVDPMTTEGVTVALDRGRSIPTYSDDATEMSVVSDARSFDNMFKITLKNKTDKTWRVADSDFTVETSDDGKSWHLERVYPSQEYYDLERSRYAASVAMVMVGSPLDEPEVVTTRTTRVWGSSGTVIVEQTRVYSEPSFRNAWLVEDYSVSGMEWLRVLQDNLFYSKDLAPQEQYFGLVFSDELDSKYYRITLKRDGAKSPSVEFQRTKKRFNPFWPD